jgi:AcrR family transcriptional regulator
MENHLILPDDPKPTRSDSVKNRALLLETAQRLFSEQGVEEVSMTAIAEAAGVGKGTLYRHFVNKAELAHVLLDQDMHDLQTRTLRRLGQNGDALETLRWFLEQVVRFVDHNAALLCVASQEGIESTLSFPAHLWWRQTIRGLLLRLQLPAQMDVDYTTDVLYVMLDIRTIYFQKHNLGYETKRILDGLDATVTLLIS